MEHHRYNGNNDNNQERIKPGNCDSQQYIQGKNAKCHHHNRQTEGKGNPFYEIYLLEEDESPGKARQKEDKYKSQECSDDGQALKERESKLKYLSDWGQPVHNLYSFP